MTRRRDLASHARRCGAGAARAGHHLANPSVGCVIVRDGRVVGRGVTAPGGRPHAEPTALAMAGEQARGATAYVTLEPCCHWGRTPPCTDALIAAGVARVVIGASDPDPRVDGSGIARLRAAGIEVDRPALLEAEALDTLAGFTHAHHAGPADGDAEAGHHAGRPDRHRTAARASGSPARRPAALAHALRGRHDAVMVGVGTVLADNPDLTCRIPGFRPTPMVRVIADSHLRTPLTSRLAATAGEVPTWFLHPRRHRPGAARRLHRTRRHLIMPLPRVRRRRRSRGRRCRRWAQAGLTRVLVEGGGQLAAALLRADLVDRIAWFHAPGHHGRRRLARRAGVRRRRRLT